MPGGGAPAADSRSDSPPKPPATPGASPNGSPGASPPGSDGKIKKPKQKKSDLIMKQFNRKMGMAKGSIPKAMLEGQFLRLNRWSSIVDDEALHHLSMRNQQRMNESKLARMHALEVAKGKGLDAMSVLTKSSVSGSDGGSAFYEGVKVLEMNMADRVTDYGLAALGRGCTTLEELDLSNCSGITDVGLRAMAMGCSQLRKLNLAHTKNVKGMGYIALGQNCLNMQELSISGNRKLEPWLLKRIAEFDKLVYLNISRCERCDDYILKSIANNCRGMKKLDISYNPIVSDVGILEISKGCPNLEDLSMPRKSMPYKITDVALLSLGERCKGMTRLDLTGNSNLTNAGLNWLCEGCHAMKILNLCHLNRLDDSGMRCLNEGMGQLEDLDLNGLNQITDVGLRHIAMGCKKLRRIVLSGVYLLTNGMNRDFGLEGLQAFAKEVSTLRSLTLNNCFQVASLALGAVTKSNTSLTELRLAGCQKVDAHCMKIVAKHCPKLKILSLAGCDKVDSDAIKAIAKRSKGLTNVNLSQCAELSDAAIQGLVHYCKGLIDLDLADCRNLTDYSILSIVEAEMHPGLRSLNLTRSQVTDTGCTWLAERCTSLLKLDITGTGVSFSGMKAIRESWSHVHLERNNKFFGLKPVPRGADLRHIDEYGALWAAVTKIQAVYRAKQARRYAAIRREEYLRNWVATHLQAVWRGRQARQYAALKRMQRNRQDDAARYIQNAFRKRQARKELQLRKEQAWHEKEVWAACLVQRIWRGKLIRGIAHAAKLARQAYMEKCTKSALMIQSAWRAREGRMAFQLAKAAKLAAEQEQERAASKLQTIYRGRLARKQMLKKKKAKLQHAGEEEKAAIKIQAIFRGRKARRIRQQKIEYEKARTKAAIKIQSAFRARTGRMVMYMKKNALRAQKEEEAAIKIQCAWRRKQGMLGMLLRRKAMEEQRKEEDRAARKLQRIYRGHAGRRKYKRQHQQATIARKKQENLEEWAATKVQKTFRGKLGRQRFKARQVEVAMRWKTMFDEEQQRPFYYNMNTGEIRWRKPQMLLDLDPRPPCDNCDTTEALVECGDCHEFYCQECWDAVHFGGKRKKHKFRCLYDYYKKRVDYGDGEFPSKWPSELTQDEMYGWHKHGEDPRSNRRADQNPSSSALSLPLENIQKWTKYWDETSGAFFYFNSELSESTYERPLSYRSAAPTPRAVDPEEQKAWGKHKDDENNVYFYYNSKTGESTYVRPDGFATPAPTPREGDVAVGSDANSGWEKHWSDEFNMHYFFNRRTQVSTFDRPEGFATPHVTPAPTPRQNQLALEAGTSGWQKFWDDDNETEFYYHETMGISQYERPTEYFSPSPTPRSGQPAAGGAQNGGGAGEWARYFDDNTQTYFYYNNNTSESTYERPQGYFTPR